MKWTGKEISERMKVSEQMFNDYCEEQKLTEFQIFMLKETIREKMAQKAAKEFDKWLKTHGEND